GMSIGTSNYRPHFRKPLSHGLPGLEFDNSNDRLHGTYDHMNAQDPLTVIVVYRQKDLSGGYRVVNSRTEDFLMAARNDNANTYSAFNTSTGAQGQFLSSDYPVGFESDRFVIHTYRYNGATGLAEHWVDGQFVGSRMAPSIHRSIVLGVGFSANPANAEVSEFMIYGKALLENDRVDAEVYLANKYGLYHLNASWIGGFNAASQTLINSNKYSLEEFISNHGSHSDGVWISSYSQKQQDYINENMLSLSEVPILPGPLESSFELDQGLIFFAPLRTGFEDQSSSSWDVSNPPGGFSIDSADRFGIAASAPSFADRDYRLVVPAGLNPPNAMTVSMWTNPQNFTGEDVIFAGYDGTTDTDETFYFGIESSGFRFTAWGAPGTGSATAFRSPTLNVWQHLVGRYSYDSNLNSSEISLALDLNNSASYSFVGPINQADQPVGIGAHTGNSSAFNGLVNDVVVWDRALTDEELGLLHFIQLSPSHSAELEGFLKFDSPAPEIGTATYGGVDLVDGATIADGSQWQVNLGVGVNIETVELLVDGNIAGTLTDTGNGEYTLASGFQVTPGYHTVRIVATNRDGDTDELLFNLQFEGNSAPTNPPSIEAIYVGNESLGLAPTLTGSDFVSTDILPMDDFSVSSVRYILREQGSSVQILSPESNDPNINFSTFLNLQGQAGKILTLEAVAETPFSGQVTRQESFSVESPVLSDPVTLEWIVPSDDSTQAHLIEYELGYAASAGMVEPVEVSHLWTDMVGGRITVDPSTQTGDVLSHSWDTQAAGIEDTDSLFLRMRAFDGSKFSEWDVSGPYSYDDGVPAAASVSIQSSGFVSNPAITLSLSAGGATEIVISELADLSDKNETDWQPFVDTVDYTLSATLGVKNVYVGFRDMFESVVIASDSTELVAAQTVVYDQNSASFVIDPATFVAGDHLLIDEVTVTLDGPITVGSMQLINGAKLTTSATTSTQEYRLNLKVLGALTIDASSSIDVSGKGYLAGFTQGNFEYSITEDDKAGGSHGGLGAFYHGASSNSYGNFTYPTDLGSGATIRRSIEGVGGGAIYLDVVDLILDGAILANGLFTTVNKSSGGAGGSILIEAATISGSGSIRANGGNGMLVNSLDLGGGGGGGGRVAVYYETLGATIGLEAYGGQGGSGKHGGAGTIYLEETDVDQAGVGTLIVDNNGNTGADTPLASVGSGILGTLLSPILGLSPSASPSDWTAIIGLWVEPDTINNSGSYFQIVDASSASSEITVSPDPTNIADVGDYYQGVINLDSIEVRGNAIVRSVDPISSTTSLTEGNGPGTQWNPGP
ncbi:MAG: LamG domain-containing protein, partial [Verrucomicrobiota bacterium]